MLGRLDDVLPAEIETIQYYRIRDFNLKLGSLGHKEQRNGNVIDCFHFHFEKNLAPFSSEKEA
jgi:hypothetical protein